MKKKIAKSVLLILIVMITFFMYNSVFAETTAKNEIISTETKSQLVNITNKEKNAIEDYYDLYGSKTYGTVAYVLNKVRLYSISL